MYYVGICLAVYLLDLLFFDTMYMAILIICTYPQSSSLADYLISSFKASWFFISCFHNDLAATAFMILKSICPLVNKHIPPYDCPFPKVGYVSSLEGMCILYMYIYKYKLYDMCLKFQLITSSILSYYESTCRKFPHFVEVHVDNPSRDSSNLDRKLEIFHHGNLRVPPRKI